MTGKRQLCRDEEYIPSILFREESNVKHYISMTSENSYKLTTTTVSDASLITILFNSFTPQQYLPLSFIFRKEILQQLFWSNP